MRSTRTDAALAALFWGPLALAAALIIAWPPHTVDGPAHLLGARAIAERGSSSHPYGAYYDYDWFPTPNLAGTRLLGALVGVGGLRFAATVLLLLAALGTPLALRYAIRGVRPESAWLAIAGLPLAFGYLYFYGFWNYCLGIALAMVCAGLALRTAPDWRLRPVGALAGLLTLTWLTHLVPFVAAVLFVAAVAATGPRQRRSLVSLAVTVAPGAGLSLAYLAHTESGDGPTWTNPVGRAVGLVSLHTTITTFSRWEDLIAATIAAVLVALAIRAVRAGGAGTPAPAWAAVGAAVVVLVTPTNFGIDFGLIDERLAVFPVLFGLLWLAGRAPTPRTALVAACALVAATGALAAVRLPELRDVDELADEYVSAGRFVDEGSVLVALRFASYGPDAGRNSAWDPTRHLASELAAQRYAIDVGHYEAVLDYFPARFRPQLDLRRVLDPDLAGLAAVPSVADLDPARIRAVVGEAPVIYVLLVGAPDATGEAATALATTRTMLARGYERVGTTSPRGLVEVWRLR